MFLKHLEFDVPFLVVDTTSVTFQGKVVVGGTAKSDSEENENNPEVFGEGCPIHGAEVCLSEKNAAGTDVEHVCRETDADGLFSVPALIGSTVVVDIKYENHTFAAVDASKASLYDAGIPIRSGESYTNFDFKDTTTSDLHVEVAGGLCNKKLGDATLKVNILGCPSWNQQFTQVSFVEE